MSDLFILGEKRGPGRPRELSESEVISARIPVQHYDRLARVALRTNQSVSTVIRVAVARFLKDESSGFPST